MWGSPNPSENHTFLNNALDLAFLGVLAPSVQRFPAKTAVRPAVAAGSPSWAHWQHQAVPQQSFVSKQVLIISL